MPAGDSNPFFDIWLQKRGSNAPVDWGIGHNSGALRKIPKNCGFRLGLPGPSLRLFSCSQMGKEWVGLAKACAFRPQHRGHIIGWKGAVQPELYEQTGIRHQGYGDRLKM
jgi:hypothetical protein